jgi:3-hydroxybutyryl-CoA dehydrogenase
LKQSRFLIAGIGNIGKQVFQKIFSSGLNADIFDISEQNIEIFKNYMTEKLKTDKKKQFLKNTEFISDYNDIKKEYSIIIECINENPFTKLRFYKKISETVSEKTILTTSTSSMTASDFKKAIKKPERFCAMHFNAPDYGADIVEIMPHKETSEATVMYLMEFIKTIGLEPYILKKEINSYIFNKLLEALTGEALNIYIEGICDYKEIDKIWKKNTGMNIGPFEMLDITGIDTAYDVTRLKAEQAKDSQNLNKIKELLKQYTEQGKTGKKSGEGFYKY